MNFPIAWTPMLNWSHHGVSVENPRRLTPNLKLNPSGGRGSTQVDFPTKQQKDLARSNAADIPVLTLLRQNGHETKGWRGLPFWWPVILTPRSGVTVIFSTDEAVAATMSNPDA